MKTLPIDFFDLYTPMKDQSRDMYDYYLDTETGEVISVDTHLFNRLEEGEELEPYDIPQWMEGAEEQIEAILNDDKNRFLRVPEVYSPEAYDIMKRFVSTVQDQQIADQLWDAINQRKPFRRFKDVLAEHRDLFKEWDAFEEKAYMEIAREWLNSRGIEPEWQ